MSVEPAEMFRQEALDLLDQLEQALLDLERAPADTALVDTAFRALHTIKGSGAMFGFDAVAGFTHHVENAFALIRNGGMAPTRPLVAIALAAKDHIRRLIEQPQTAAEAAPEGEAILGRLHALQNDPAEAAEAASVPTTARELRIRMRLAADVMRMGTNPLLLLDELRALGDCAVRALTADIPVLDELDATLCHVGWEVTLTTAQPRSAIEDVFLFVIDDMELAIEDAPEAAVSVPSPPLKKADLRLTRSVPPPAPVADPPLRKATFQLTCPPAAAPSAKAGRQADSIRVPAARLDELMDRVGELVIVQSRLKQVAMASAEPQVKSIAEEIERLALDLRDTTMGVRMVPIESLFGRFRRMVHDLARDLGKQIEFSTAGEDTEIDKTVSERLGDPLVHLIRNSVDHGLEPAAERLAAGKSAAGRIVLSAAHAGNEVLITIRDDGRGLDRARIRQRAEEQGLLPANAAASDNELFACLFMPGFSTAKEVTSLSGRGVGMDVVKRTIEQLRGSVDIASQPGQGTTMVLRLPLTLAIIDGLLVRVGAGRYVIPLSCVEECVELSAADDARSSSRSLLNLRGGMIPFLRLRQAFGATAPADRFQKVVIVATGDQRIGLVVDQIIGDHQTVIKSLSKLHASARMFSGATILGDGTVALILEVAQLVGLGQLRDEPRRMAS